MLRKHVPALPLQALELVYSWRLSLASDLAFFSRRFSLRFFAGAVFAEFFCGDFWAMSGLLGEAHLAYSPTLVECSSYGPLAQLVRATDF